MPFLIAVLVLASPVLAYGVLPPQPLDRLLGGDGRFNCSSILHVTFERVKSPPRRGLVSGPPDVRIEIAVRSVILGAEYRVGQREILQVGSFRWPRELVPLSGGEGVLMFLRGVTLCSVLPTRSEGFETAKDRDAARVLVAADLLATLGSEVSAAKRRMLIKNLERILGPADVGSLSPYLEDEDRWVRWAALAALVRLTKDAGLLSRAAVEMGEALAEMSSDRSLRQRHFLLFDHFHYLVMCSSREMGPVGGSAALLTTGRSFCSGWPVFSVWRCPDGRSASSSRPRAHCTQISATR